MLGDIVGKPGRKAVGEYLPGLIAEHQPDFIIANGENAAGGLGINRTTAAQIFEAGVDVITLGNHVWAQRGIEELLMDEPRLIRPKNLAPGLPGRGHGVFTAKSGEKIGVMNLLGRTFMEPVDDPFRAADAAIEEMMKEAKVIIVDMHAEATSEKAALAWYLDGRVSAVLGTHTHVPTCDGRVLPNGTAFVTDLGMVGPYNSILGLSVESIVERFRTQTKQKFEVAEGPTVLNGAILDVDNTTGRTSAISRVTIIED